MIVTGTVVSVELDIEVPKNGGGSYPGGRLAYRDSTGAMKEQCFHNNVFKFQPDIKIALANLSVGVVFDMVKEKSGEFWKVISIKPSTQTSNLEVPPKGSQNTSTGTNAEVYKTTPYTSPKSTYETPEERAKKQVYIVRQSSITAALTYIGDTKKVSTNDVIAIAKQFEAYVFDNQVELDSEEIV